MPRGWSVAHVAVVVALVMAGLLLAPATSARAVHPAGYPILPEAIDREFLGNLTAPSLDPGGGGAVAFTVLDPLPGVLSNVLLTLSLYAFNGFPGNATDGLPLASAPVLTTPTTSGVTANVSIGSLAASAVYRGSVGIASSATTPTGTYAIRTALAFTDSGTGYLLESRGWFTPGAWANATELPNGSVTLNLSALGVSGILPETAVLVGSSGLEWALVAIAATGIVLVGAGAWVYFRRESKSSDGAR